MTVGGVIRVADAGERAPAEPQRELAARFAAVPASVPSVRRFVTDAMRTLGSPALAGDAALVATELSTNAALHSGSTFVDIRLQVHGPAVYLHVEDSSLADIEAVRPPVRYDDPADGLLSDAWTRGHGLMIVASLSREWGVDPLVDGKCVWAELSPSSAEPGGRSGIDHAGPRPRGVGRMPAGWQAVRLRGVPVDLFRLHLNHFEEVLREFELMGDIQDPELARLNDGLHALWHRNLHVWQLAAMTVDAAMLVEQSVIDLDLPHPDNVSADADAFTSMMRRVDELGESRALLTMAVDPMVAACRVWMAEEYDRQLNADLEPLYFEDWLPSHTTT